MIRERGYTMIELLIAMAIFCFMMLIVSATFLSIVRVEQSANSARVAQQNNRNIADQLLTSARNANTVVIMAAGAHQWVCFNNAGGTIKYFLDSKPGDLRRIAGTADLACAYDVGGQVLNDSTVKMTQFNVVFYPGISGSLQALGSVMMTLSFAATSNLDLLNPTATPTLTSCTPGPGAQFCHVSTASYGTLLRSGS